MEQGVIHGMDKKRIYLKTKHNSNCEKCHAKHLCLSSKGKDRIIPVAKKRHHIELKKGDRVYFEINPIQSTKATSFFYGLPIIGVVAGFFVGISVTGEDIGIIMITALFTILAFDIQRLIKKRYNIFKEIDVEIMKKSPKVKVAKAKSNKKAKKKKIKKNKGSWECIR